MDTAFAISKSTKQAPSAKAKPLSGKKKTTKKKPQRKRGQGSSSNPLSRAGATRPEVRALSEPSRDEPSPVALQASSDVSTSMRSASKSVGTVYVGIDTRQPLREGQMICLLDDKEMPCGRFLAEHGWTVPPGEHDFVIRGDGMSAIANERIQAGHVYNIVLHLPGKLQLQADRPVGHVDIEIAPYLTEDEKKISPRYQESKVTIAKEALPYQAQLLSGVYEVKVTKDGYEPFLQRIEVPPLGKVELPVLLAADEKQQTEMCAFCARGRRRFRSTIDVSLGTPDWLSVRALLGLANIGDHMKIDLGLGLSTSGYVTLVRLGGQFQFFNHTYVAAAARTWFGAGGGPNQRENLLMEVGAVLSVFPKPTLSLSLYPYGQFYWDRFPTPTGLPDKSGGGQRFIMELNVEWNFSRPVNLAAAVSWAPGTERFLFSEPYTPNLLYPASDNQAAGAWYARLALVYKLPVPRLHK